MPRPVLGVLCRIRFAQVKGGAGRRPAEDTEQSECGAALRAPPLGGLASHALMPVIELPDDHGENFCV
jgi:hypothetical protein